MPELNFQIESAAAVPYAATPLLCFKLRATSKGSHDVIHTVVLRAQIQIEATRRHYSAKEQERLVDLFGEPERWGQTLRSMLWTNAAITIPSFENETVADLTVPCTFDFNVAATKYFHGLTEGDLPLNFLFSGTIFYQDANGTLQVAPISWEKEAKFRLPWQVWRALIDTYYPNTAWLCLRRDALDRLYQYKVRHGVPTWEEVIERLLSASEAPVGI